MKRRNFLIGVVFGVFYWIAIGVIGYGYNRFDNNRICVHSGICVDTGTNSVVGDNKISYVNTISHRTTAKQSLREDAVGLYGKEVREGDGGDVENQHGMEDNGTSYTGTASYYGGAFAGRTTACGNVFNPRDFSAASLRHSCGTELNVCLLGSSRCVVVVVNDTGAFEVLGRVIDLSEGAFAELAPTSRGLVEVIIQEVK